MRAKCDRQSESDDGVSAKDRSCKRMGRSPLLIVEVEDDVLIAAVEKEGFSVDSVQTRYVRNL